MRILFVGPLWPGSTSVQRKDALKEIEHEVTEVDTTPFLPREAFLPLRFLVKLSERIGCPLDLTAANRQMIDHVAYQRFDLIFIEKGLTIKPETLKRVKQLQPNCFLVAYSPDDMMLTGNQSRRYLDSIALYDLHVTTKSYNVAELKAWGAKDVYFVANAFDPKTHHPYRLNKMEQDYWKADVGFVGAYELPRYQMMLTLARVGIVVTVRGPGWEPYIDQHENFIVKPGWVYEENYSKCICATKINLGFLRKSARDLQTTRSIEIPACGAFMLAERTEEHLNLFVEDQEAVFFADEEELIKKVIYYLANDDKRQQIALNGRERCLRSGYSYAERLGQIVDYISNQLSN